MSRPPGDTDTSTWARAIALAIGLAAVAIAGAATLEGQRARLAMKTAAEREQLHDALRRFDLRLTVAEQEAARDLDARLNAMPDDERDGYLAVLRRYHNWLHQLPERLRDGVLAEPPDRRLKRIQELAIKYPPPDWRPTSSMDFIQIGGTGTFELAALCKTWLALSPADRRAVDALEAGKRKEDLARRGRDLKIPRALRPADYDEARWMEEAEARVRDLRATAAGPRDWLSRIEAKFEQAGEDAPEAPPRVRPFLRRLAENLYVEEHELDHPVAPTRLEQFFAAMPPWIRSTFAAFPADEARRRLGVVYRLVHPHPEEFRPSAAEKAPPAAAPKATRPAVAPPTPPGPGPATPF
ncbi:hypothetical protein [Paludisphaera sp.]|uniref:hypothetical protein n=1 Tax=Paludisphaera sp. TaxID=2017432 RepID=UPI00301D3878